MAIEQQGVEHDLATGLEQLAQLGDAALEGPAIGLAAARQLGRVAGVRGRRHDRRVARRRRHPGEDHRRPAGQPRVAAVEVAPAAGQLDDARRKARVAHVGAGGGGARRAQPAAALGRGERERARAVAAQVLGGQRRDLGARAEVEHPVGARIGQAAGDDVPVHGGDELRARHRGGQVAGRAQVAPVAGRQDRQRERRRIGQQPRLGGELGAQQRAGLAQARGVEGDVDAQRRPAEAQRRASAPAALALGRLRPRLRGQPRAQPRERRRRTADDDPLRAVDERHGHLRAVAHLGVDGVQQRRQPRQAHAGDRDERRLGPGVRGERGVRADRPGQPHVARQQRVADAVGARLGDEQRRQQALRVPGGGDDRAGRHRVAQAVLPDRAPQQRLGRQVERIGDRGRAQVGRGRRAAGVLGPRDEVEAVAKPPAGLARRRGGGVGEHAGGDGQPRAQVRPLGDERRELRERVGALAGERHGGPPAAAAQLAEQRGGGRGHRPCSRRRSGRFNHVFGNPNSLAEFRQAPLSSDDCRS